MHAVHMHCSSFIAGVPSASTRCSCGGGYTPLPYCQHPATRLLNGTHTVQPSDPSKYLPKASPDFSSKGDAACLTLNQSQADFWASSLGLDWAPFANPEFPMGEVRKLQKKLRQIENLEIKISLTPEERFKVQKHTICSPSVVRFEISLRCNKRSLHCTLE